DWDALRQLVQEVQTHYFGTPLSEGEVKNALDDMLLRNEVQVRVAVLAATMVGCATYTILQFAPNGYGTLFLKDLYVTASQRGTGLGRRMLADLARIAKDRGCARFDWTSETDNPRAMALYESLGARPVKDKVYYRVRNEGLSDFIAACDGVPDPS
ncbi:MAG: GNAT family N-acetyltransferase, partial [Pseudomonadota bacterium]